jgi:prepilin-type N-terminal cleavage/methylation domain-containing protein
MRKAFTLLELVVTITITGIIAGSTFQMFMNIYKSYNDIYIMNSLDSKLTNVSMQILKYLENRVLGSLVDSNSSGHFIISKTKMNKERNQTLEWIEKAFDTYSGTWNNNLNIIQPNWSGFLDLTKEHNKTILFLDDGNISQAEKIIYLISDKSINIFDSQKDFSAIFFKGGITNSIDCFSWETAKSNCGFVGYFDKNGSEYNFLSSNQTKGFEPKYIYEQFALSWTAYGLKVEDRNLSIYYNYRPWNGENIQNGTKITLLENISKFEYKSNGATVSLEICIESVSNNPNDTVEFCRKNIIY